MTAAERPAEADIDVLRRRLYRAGATGEDVARYVELRGTADAVTPAEVVLAPPRRSTRRRLALGVLVAAGAVAVTATTLLQQPSTEPVARPTASPIAVAQVVFQDVGDGQVLQVDPTRVGGPGTTSVWVDEAPVAAQRFDGSGDAVLPIDLPSASSASQRAVLAIYSATASSITWRALRPATHPDGSPYEQIMARGTVEAHRDFATRVTFDYAGRAPARIVLEPQAGVPWTLLIAAAPGATAGPR